jgi:SAM-dependent methyltransferase
MDPVIYHTHQCLRSDDMYFWRALTAEYGSPVLELGCGTGRVCMRLIRENVEVVGLDNDPAMLAYAQNTVPTPLAHLIKLVNADMRRLDLGRQFPLIILPCNTLSTFNAQERQQIFAGVRQHLRPQGIFAFATPNTLVLKTLPALGDPEIEDQFEHPATHNPIEVYSSWEMSGNDITFHWQYLHLFPNGNTVEDQHYTTHHLDPPQTYVAELRSAGLKPISAFGDFDRANFTPESAYFIMLAQRPD